MGNFLQVHPEPEPRSPLAQIESGGGDIGVFGEAIAGSMNLDHFNSFSLIM